jgi:hypothetical protein
MSDLPDQFASALTTIEPDTDVKNAIVARDRVVAVLEADEQLLEWGISPVLIGSYKRHVSIKRIKDVDVFCRLTALPEETEPQEILDHFQAVLEEEFPGQVEPQGRSVKVTFDDLDMHVDAVPTRPAGEDWEIPRKEPESGWELTNPERLSTLTTELNKQLDERYVPVVKLMRQTRRSVIADKKPRGHTMEVLTYWALEAVDSTDSMAECFVLALEGAADVLEEHIDGTSVQDPALDGADLRMGATDSELKAFADKLRSAASDARGALDSDDDCESARTFRSILGKNSEGEYVFPLPEGCEGYGTERSSFSVTPGAESLPSKDSPRFG